MGIAASDLPLLITSIAAVRKNKTTPLRVLCIGYPDVLLSPANYQTLSIDGNKLATLVDRPDSAMWLERHNIKPGEITSIPTIESFLSLFVPVEVDIMDISSRTGKEIIFDLNNKIPAEMHGTYDLIIDPGSTQFVFDTATCLFNYVNLLRVGGAIYHCLPLIRLNQGFYNFQPNLFVDFYKANGMAVLGLHGSRAGTAELTNPTLFNVPAYDRFKPNNYQEAQTVEICMHVAASKVENVQPTIPICFTYRKATA